MNAKTYCKEDEDARCKRIKSGNKKKPLTTSRAEHQVDHRADHKVGNRPFNDPSSSREGMGSLNGRLSTL